MDEDMKKDVYGMNSLRLSKLDTENEDTLWKLIQKGTRRVPWEWECAPPPHAVADMELDIKWDELEAACVEKDKKGPLLLELIPVESIPADEFIFDIEIENPPQLPMTQLEAANFISITFGIDIGLIKIIKCE